MHRLYRKFTGFQSKLRYRTTPRGFKIPVGFVYTWDSQEMKLNTIDMKPEEARRRGITREKRESTKLREDKAARRAQYAAIRQAAQNNPTILNGID